MGCCALHVVWEDLAEILALAVNPKCVERNRYKACLSLP